MKKEHSSVKLRKLKDIRRKDLERNFLNIDIEKAQVIYEEGRWVKEHIKTAVLKFNYEIDKTNNMLIRDFEDKYIQQYEKTLK